MSACGGCVCDVCQRPLCYSQIHTHTIPWIQKLASPIQCLYIQVLMFYHINATKIFIPYSCVAQGRAVSVRSDTSAQTEVSKSRRQSKKSVNMRSVSLLNK